ncbi:MAG: HEAT repeat domain-containing protein [Candidatus Aminicenantes bacterium]|nr:MAG: HEAT repeat domain-containing protein [Candidatus Aminicenantes bacterium]
MKLSTSLLIISWIPLIQLQILRFNIELNWIFLVSIVLSFIGVWLWIKSIPEDSKLNQWVVKFLSIAFFSILLFGIPVFFYICKFFEIKIQGFNYLESQSPFPLIVSIISAGLVCSVLFLAWKEVQEEDKPYIPVLKFILASIFLLWQLNLGIHLYYNFPHEVSYSDYFPQRDVILPYLESYHYLKVLIFIFYMIQNLLFFGAIFLKGKFRERQNLLFSITGLLMVIGVFTIIFGLVNGTQLITNYYIFSFAIMVTMSFITIMKPVLMTAMVLTLIGGMLSFFRKGLGRSGVPVPVVIRKKGVILALATVVLYVFLFGAPWPFQDPAINVHMGVIKNRWEKGFNNDLFDSRFYYGFLLYGKCAMMPLVNKLNDNAPIIRAVAAEYLGYLGDERAVEPLIKALNDRDKVVILQAARALAELKEPRALDILLKKLDHEDKELRESVVRALGFFKDVRVVDKLIEQLKKEKARDVIFTINYELYMITGHGEPYPGEKGKSAEWWQQWWKQNRQNFIEKHGSES